MFQLSRTCPSHHARCLHSDVKDYIFYYALFKEHYYYNIKFFIFQIKALRSASRASSIYSRWFLLPLTFVQRVGIEPTTSAYSEASSSNELPQHTKANTVFQFITTSGLDIHKGSTRTSPHPRRQPNLLVYPLAGNSSSVGRNPQCYRQSIAITCLWALSQAYSASYGGSTRLIFTKKN